MPIGPAGPCNEQPQKTDHGECRPGGMFPCHLAGPAAGVRDGPAGIDAEIGGFSVSALTCSRNDLTSSSMLAWSGTPTDPFFVSTTPRGMVDPSRFSCAICSSSVSGSQLVRDSNPETAAGARSSF